MGCSKCNISLREGEMQTEIIQWISRTAKSIKGNSTGVSKKVVWNFHVDSGHFKKIPMVLVPIYDGISVGGVKISSKIWRNFRGGKKLDVLIRRVWINNSINNAITYPMNNGHIRSVI